MLAWEIVFNKHYRESGGVVVRVITGRTPFKVSSFQLCGVVNRD